jgi:hypothetical protein
VAKSLEARSRSACPLEYIQAPPTSTTPPTTGFDVNRVRMTCGLEDDLWTWSDQLGVRGVILWGSADSSLDFYSIHVYICCTLVRGVHNWSTIVIQEMHSRLSLLKTPQLD